MTESPSSVREKLAGIVVSSGLQSIDANGKMEKSKQDVHTKVMETDVFDLQPVVKSTRIMHRMNLKTG